MQITFEDQGLFMAGIQQEDPVGSRFKKGDGSVVSYAICAGGTKQLTTYFFTVSWLNSFGAVGVRFLA